MCSKVTCINSHVKSFPSERCPGLIFCQNIMGSSVGVISISMAESLLQSVVVSYFAMEWAVPKIGV